MTDKETRRQVEDYDSERARGIVHTRAYGIKMEQYRIVLFGHKN